MWAQPASARMRVNASRIAGNAHTWRSARLQSTGWADLLAIELQGWASGSFLGAA
jgi:hypothetical protein